MSMFLLFEHLLRMSTIFICVQSQYPGAPPAEPVSYPKIPTSSNWDNFQCFSDEELAEIREEYFITDDKVAIWSKFKYQVDDWSLDSLAFSILHRELLGVNIELFSFYHGATSLIGGQSDSALFHSGIFKKDFRFHPAIEAKTAGTDSQTKWRMRGDVRDEIELELEADWINNRWLSHWRLFTDPVVIAMMNSSDEVIIEANEDGQFACQQHDGCLHGDSTWYPPQCNFTTNAHHNCMVLLQFLPEHDSEFNRNFILDEQVPIVIKYLGSEKSFIGQSNFQRFYNDRFRVIFQLRSVETKSLDQMGWSSIALPNDNDIISSEAILRLRPSWLLNWALNLYILHEFSSLTPAQSQQIQLAIFAANQPETVDLRMNAVCNWLKHPLSQKYGWNFWMMMVKLPSISAYECDKISDEDLEFILTKTDEEILASPLSGDDFLAEVSSMDSYRAIYVKSHCVLDTVQPDEVALQICGFILWGMAVVALVTAIVGTIYWRKEKIIVASSVMMLAIIYLGAAITLLYQMFLGADILSHCYLRKFILQIGVVMMFAALEEKTRRLATIQSNIRVLKSVKITDFQLMMRIGAMLSLVIIYLSVLVAVFPIDVKERIVDRQKQSMCEWDERAEKAWKVLIAAECLALSLIGRLSWTLRTTNEVYNETAWITFILFASVLLLAGYLMSGLLEPLSTQLIVGSYFVTTSVTVVISAIYGPKMLPIVRGTVYSPDSLQYDSFSISVSLTNEDLRLCRKYLRRFGYRVYKGGEGVDEGEEMESTARSARRRSSLARFTEKSISAFFRSDSLADGKNVSKAADVAIAIENC